MSSSASKFVTLATMLFVVGVGVTLLRKAGVEPGSVDVPLWLELLPILLLPVWMYVALVYFPTVRRI